MNEQVMNIINEAVASFTRLMEQQIDASVTKRLDTTDPMTYERVADIATDVAEAAIRDIDVDEWEYEIGRIVTNTVAEEFDINEYADGICEIVSESLNLNDHADDIIAIFERTYKDEETLVNRVSNLEETVTKLVDIIETLRRVLNAEPLQ